LLFLDGHSTRCVTEEGFQLRADARRFELYEKNRALALGLGEAIDYALSIGVDRIWQRIRYLAGMMRQQLGALPGITVHDSGDQQCGIVTFSVDGIESVQVKNELAVKNINVSVGKASSTLIYMNRKHLTAIVRASVHYYNTEEEIDALCKVLSDRK
jgi:selenocysteine lyase/cysteine desulfurase